MSHDAPILNIIGERVALGPVHRGLLPLWTRWFNDFEVTRTLAVGLYPVTPEFEQSFYDRVSGQRIGGADAVFCIYERAGLRPVGSTGLHGIDLVNRTAEFGIAIGEKDAWGKGYGAETARLMLEYGFTALGLHHIYLRAYAYNERGLAAYRRAGFTETGRLRQAHRLGGRAYDVILMDCLVTEFEGGALTHLVPDSGTA